MAHIRTTRKACTTKHCKNPLTKIMKVRHGRKIWTIVKERESMIRFHRLKIIMSLCKDRVIHRTRTTPKLRHIIINIGNLIKGIISINKNQRINNYRVNNTNNPPIIKINGEIIKISKKLTIASIIMKMKTISFLNIMLV